MNNSKETKEKTCCGPECCSDDNTDTAVLENDLTKEKSEEELKQIVKDQYSQIALQSKEQNESSCCGSTSACCGDVNTFSIMADEYKSLKGYNPDADLGLGCGLPTQFAKIKKGDTVVDLGSGAGNDCFVARAETGETGRVIGIDMTPAMVEKAKANAAKLGFSNVEFHLAEIENMPLNDNTADVVVSNCVLNLVPNKVNAFREVYRILKPGGHFSISDIVLTGELPVQMKAAATMYAGCVSGAVQKDDYLNIVKNAGFRNITVQKEKLITIPDQILLDYMTADEAKQFIRSGSGIYSITVYAEK
ncbi:MAG: SAM-dependent methyltransferase [Chlorobi bacterium OLB5]|nr:MAG: SAM-dependent methyltransferase [Chlorobi bacterium OLB5]